jgi:hypothetical protein
MLTFKEWRKVEATNPRKKKKDTNDEQRSSQTNGESGNVHQQGQADRGNPQVAQQTIHVFAVPEL